MIHVSVCIEFTPKAFCVTSLIIQMLLSMIHEYACVHRHRDLEYVNSEVGGYSVSKMIPSNHQR